MSGIGVECGRYDDYVITKNGKRLEGQMLESCGLISWDDAIDLLGFLDDDAHAFKSVVRELQLIRRVRDEGWTKLRSIRPDQ
jgi:hypothetical protein